MVADAAAPPDLANRMPDFDLHCSFIGQRSQPTALAQAQPKFWTRRLTHDTKRRKDECPVDRRDGSSSRFTFVSGQRHPDDPDL